MSKFWTSIFKFVLLDIKVQISKLWNWRLYRVRYLPSIISKVCDFKFDHDIEGLNYQKLRYWTWSCEASISKQYDIELEEISISKFLTSKSKYPDIKDLSISKNAPSVLVYPDNVVLSFDIEIVFCDIEATMIKFHWFHSCALPSLLLYAPLMSRIPSKISRERRMTAWRFFGGVGCIDVNLEVQVQ